METIHFANTLYQQNLSAKRFVENLGFRNELRRIKYENMKMRNMLGWLVLLVVSRGT